MALSGTGTLEDPFLITTLTELREANQIYKHYKVVNDLDAIGTIWEENWTAPLVLFLSLDFGNHKVRNLICNDNSFLYCNQNIFFTIKNLVLENAKFTNRPVFSANYNDALTLENTSISAFFYGSYTTTSFVCPMLSKIKNVSVNLKNQGTLHSVTGITDYCSINLSGDGVFTNSIVSNNAEKTYILGDFTLKNTAKIFGSGTVKESYCYSNIKLDNSTPKKLDFSLNNPSSTSFFCGTVSGNWDGTYQTETSTFKILTENQATSAEDLNSINFFVTEEEGV